MNPLAMILTVALSTLAGGVVTFTLYQPDQLKSDLHSAQTEIKSTQTELNKCQQTITGMLMNK